MAGRTIYAKRKHLQGFLNPFNENPFTNTVTTEIEITHEARRKSISALPEQGVQGFDTKPDFDPYSVNIEVAPLDKQSTPLPNLLNVRNITRDVATQEANAEAWLYARVAFLFFVVLLIVWVSLPSRYKISVACLNANYSCHPASTGYMHSLDQTTLISVSTMLRLSHLPFKDS